ncbi:peptidase M32 [Vibrio sp. UCD-FRSSP16_10]|uniref:carboxypeptidase M32 n=1 Tax=unclassified Vibrio TaxID=2614977 RepID=UPI0008015699|nr:MULTISPECIES: carboxypeptidase M32 [unclassified Vibrio]OBT13523.1 peptidase M32 [Vibrio sp. UCD-FRSSP16_30]OBT19982.1 peptidase M32 [Vibrio sp. UCD-FRSSP16_10]
MSAFQSLKDHFQKIDNFNHLSAICGWDAAAMMPSGGNESRGRAMAELSVHVHQLKTLPQLEEWFGKASEQSLTTQESAQLREMKRSWLMANVLPTKLVEAKSLAGSKCEHAWRTQRGENDWNGFAKNWQPVVALSQEEAQIRAQATGLTPYDAMLDIFEPGTNCDSLTALFDNVKTWLPTLIDDVIEKQATESIIVPSGTFSTEKQKALGLQVMKLLQFDFNHGRLDESVHPFCGGVAQDVRITTRYDEHEFMQSLMGIVHETGHARYEQGLPSSLSGNPSGEARSMGIHESQSLFFEMQLGRSKPFIDHLSHLAGKQFTDHNPALFEATNLNKLYTRAKKDFIRVDADELTYPAHVILRFEIERDLINGKIAYNDVPELWDAKMQSYLGLSTAGNYKNGCMQDIHWTDVKGKMSPTKTHNYRDGCMQDIHWCDGSFGYFPSYTLGAMYAAQFMATMKKTISVEDVVASGDLSPIFTWLSENIWSKGSLLSTDELVKQATGETLNPQHFKDHLINRYL